MIPIGSAVVSSNVDLFENPSLVTEVVAGNVTIRSGFPLGYSSWQGFVFIRAGARVTIEPSFSETLPSFFVEDGATLITQTRPSFIVAGPSASIAGTTASFVCPSLVISRSSVSIPSSHTSLAVSSNIDWVCPGETRYRFDRDVAIAFGAMFMVNSFSGNVYMLRGSSGSSFGAIGQLYTEPGSHLLGGYIYSVLDTPISFLNFASHNCPSLAPAPCHIPST
jgi:hypothetical protein